MSGSSLDQVLAELPRLQDTTARRKAYIYLVADVLSGCQQGGATVFEAAVKVLDALTECGRGLGD